jgi:hypothetical protein
VSRKARRAAVREGRKRGAGWTRPNLKGRFKRFGKDTIEKKKEDE